MTRAVHVPYTIEQRERCGARIAAVMTRRTQAGLMFGCAGKGLSHTAQAKSPSRTTLSWPQAAQRRKTTLCVKPPGCARPRRSSVLAGAGQKSGSGQ